MRNTAIQALVATLLCIVTASCGDQDDELDLGSETSTRTGDLDLSGRWSCAGYGCGTATLTEAVEITQANGAFTAVKITGDDCVPAGLVTFRGTLPTDPAALAKRPLAFPIENQAGAPGEPKNFIPATLTVQADGTFSWHSASNTADVVCRRTR